jgi:hypothetical protein
MDVAYNVKESDYAVKTHRCVDGARTRAHPPGVKNPETSAFGDVSLDSPIMQILPVLEIDSVERSFYHLLSASGRISESCFATTTFDRFEEQPDADRG